MFTPGMPRPANAGRKAGTPNRATREAAALAEELGIDPLRVLLCFVGGRTDELGLKPYVDGKGRQRDPIVPLDLRVQATIAACRHLYPQLKSVEHAGPGGGPMEHFLSMGEDALRARQVELDMALGDE